MGRTLLAVWCGSLVALAACEGCGDPNMTGTGGGTGGGGAGGTASLSGSVTVFQGAGAGARGRLDPALKRAALEGLSAATPKHATTAAQRLAPLAAQRLGLKAPYTSGRLLGVNQAPRLREGEVIVRFHEQLPADEALRRLRVEGLTLRHGGFASEYLHLAVYERADGRPLTEGQTRELVAQLATRPGVKFTEANGMRQALAVPNDNLYPAMWHLPPINLPAAWDLERGLATPVTVAVVDTGIFNHPDLVSRLVPGYDMIVDTRLSNDGDGRDADPTDPGGDAPNGGSSWHGTHCAGTIGADTNNGSGVAGVNWNARLVPVRVLGKTGGTDFDIAAGMNWASGGTVPGLPANANPASVVSMSLGGPGDPSQAYQDIIDPAVARNVIFVVAAGNDNINASGFTPCNQANVLCVGATRFNGKRASYSNFGPRIDVMAPGGEVAEDSNGDGYPDGVLSTLKDEQGNAAYAFENGTSMAAPHVAGIVSLMKARLATLNFTQARQLLTSTASAASQCTEGCGAGLVNVHAVLQQLSGSGPTGPARLSLGTSELFFTPTQFLQTLQLTNTGGQALNLTITPAGAEASRLAVGGGPSHTLAPGASKAVTIDANLNGLAPGATGSASLNLTSNGGNATIAVKLRVPQASTRSAAVALIFQDAQAMWQVAATAEAPAPGFAWSLTAPAGRYYLFGVQDSNGTGDYEEGDPIGLYPNTDSPTELVLTGGQVLTGLTFGLAPEVSVSDTEATLIGTACTADGPCAPGYCGNFPGGYCTQNCATESCPLGSRCVAGDGFAVCLASCPGPRAGQSDCRPGYVCENDGSGAGVCIPACTSNPDCAPQTCNLTTGYCQ